MDFFVKPLQTWVRSRVAPLYQWLEPYINPSLFVGGFSFDVATLDRIDHWWGLIHQGIYLILAAACLLIEERLRARDWVLPPKLHFLETWISFAAHFFFGALLSVYTVFYFKSASLVTSFIFMAFLALLLIINEFEKIQKAGFPIRFMLLSLCISSYMLYLIPIVLGKIGAFPFLLSIIASVLLYLLFIKKCFQARHFLFSTRGQKERLLGLAVPLIFSILFFFKFIPPVPLSISDVGIYHYVTRTQDHFELQSTRSRWRFWERGDQTFLSRPGDTVYCFVRVFAPTQLKDDIQVRWMKRVNDAWQTTDRIPVRIIGGRDKGFRAYTFKNNYSPGKWRVVFETSDQRELGRLAFDVIEDPQPQSERTIHRKFVKI